MAYEQTQYNDQQYNDASQAGTGPVFGDEVWQDDDEVRTVSGTHYDPWRTWDECMGEWKYPLGLMQFLMDTGFRCPTPIQAHTWPVLMDKKDVVGVAKTGSGKTLGYLLPGYVRVKRLEIDMAFDHNTGPAMLVMAPTRELCLQISEESIRFGEPAGIRTACIYGGVPKHAQLAELRRGPQCVAATPGRLNDLLRSRQLFLHSCSYFVLDEADRMLDMGFTPQIEELMQYLPQERQTAFFTATWPPEVRRMAQKVCSGDTTHIQVGSDHTTSNKDITQHVKVVYSEKEKMEFLQTEIFPMLCTCNGSALIFCKTKRAVQNMHWTLKQQNGAPIVQLHGDMEQRDRDNALRAFKEGKEKLLVATDVAQRGLDIKNVNMVINYDPPATLEDYTHRIGRTGRAGEKGDAWTLLMPSDSSAASNIAKAMRKAGQTVPEELRSLLGGGGGGGGSWNRSGGSNGWANYRG